MQASVYHSHLHFMSENVITWLYLAAMETLKNNVYLGAQLKLEAVKASITKREKNENGY